MPKKVGRFLPHGSVLTVDVKNAPIDSATFLPCKRGLRQATRRRFTLARRRRCLSYGPNGLALLLPAREIGPAVLRPAGSVFATGPA